MAKTFDLSTLQLAEGTHTIQVKARATGFKDSNFSNSVTYEIVSSATITITIAQELSTNRKDYIKIYDGENSTGTLLFESTGQVSTPNPGTLTITTGKMYFDIQPSIGMLWTKYTTTGNITPSSDDSFDNPYQKVFTVSGECSMSLTIDWDD